MARGPQAKALTPGQIDRLRRYVNAKRYSIPQLKLAMAAPFHWRVLARALEGEAVRLINHVFIVNWLDRCVPDPHAAAMPLDFKTMAAGERERDANAMDDRRRLRSE